MAKRTDISSIMIIGAGPIVIGQACEFDYSGTQACKALREEGYRVILVNSNPATIMTDPDLADATYVEPITPEVVARIIEKENYAKRYSLDVYYEVAERFAQYAADREIHPVTLAVAWVQSHPAITAPIIGGRNLEQLAPSLAAAEFDMSDAQRAELSMLSPTPPPATDRLETQV